MFPRPAPARRERASTYTFLPASADGLGCIGTDSNLERDVSIRNLDKIFEPHRVAVIGASDTPTSVGYTVLRNLVGSGFRGVVYPVNPKREAVQGVQAYKDIPSLPHAPIWP